MPWINYQKKFTDLKVFKYEYYQQSPLNVVKENHSTMKIKLLIYKNPQRARTIWASNYWVDLLCINILSSTLILYLEVVVGKLCISIQNEFLLFSLIIINTHLNNKFLQAEALHQNWIHCVSQLCSCVFKGFMSGN